MRALCERLRKYRGGDSEWRDLMDKAITTLEQQAAEIERLRAGLENTLAWAVAHDEGCDTDPEYGDPINGKCDCGLDRVRDQAMRLLSTLPNKDTPA